MAASEAQIRANQRNAALSTGPRSAVGRETSARNSYKHGMAGNGIVIPQGDSAKVEYRHQGLLVEMGATTIMGAYYCGRLAELTVRVERCSRNDRANIDFTVGHAVEKFNEARLAEVDHMISWCGQEPRTTARRLRLMPEGIDRLIKELLELHEELNTGRWDCFHGEKVSCLMGDLWMKLPVTRVRALSEAINGRFEYLDPEDGAGLSKTERTEWARHAMGTLIDDEVDVLFDLNWSFANRWATAIK